MEKCAAGGTAVPQVPGPELSLPPEALVLGWGSTHLHPPAPTHCMAGAARRGPRARVSPAIISSPGAEPLRSCEWFGAGTSGLATRFLIPDLSPNPALVSLRFRAASGVAKRLHKHRVGWFGEG